MLRAHFEGEVSDVCGAEVLYKAELPFGESHRSVPYEKTFKFSPSYRWCLLIGNRRFVPGVSSQQSSCILLMSVRNVVFHPV